MNSAMSCSNNKHALDDGKRTAKLVSAIPNTAHGRLYRRMQEVVQEVRVSGSDRHSHLQTALRGSEGKFFTPLRLVGPPGLEPGTNRL